MLHPGGRPNVAKGLLGALSTISGRELTAEDLIAYIAGVTAHPGFTEKFTEELDTPGIRVPITTDLELLQQAIDLGRHAIWLHTYAERFTDIHGSDVRYPAGDPHRITNLTAVNTMPTAMTYDPGTATIHIGGGSFGPVPQAVWSYTVGAEKSSNLGSTIARATRAAAAPALWTTSTQRPGRRNGTANSSTCCRCSVAS
ncbi:hypothetical protein MAGR_60470 [Mycolicibacterium agri]|uniref:Type ISP restriction-modification enzyme LLaBIII C-terminal specificity domain-containing protein n=2 Tax=Mycolicibacterium agri TaxID=36811 RepID=A0A7I9WBM2_MYCAG|nr:hypothetical protein MAGR_60470 [Mycolicibacterium agri]